MDGAKVNYRYFGYERKIILSCGKKVWTTSRSFFMRKSGLLFNKDPGESRNLYCENQYYRRGKGFLAMKINQELVGI